MYKQKYRPDKKKLDIEQISSLDLGKRKRVQNHKGYVLIDLPEHPYCTREGKVLEHRIVVEVVQGRFLDRCEVVHHRNHNRSDNHPDNLVVHANNKEHRIKEHF